MGGKGAKALELGDYSFVGINASAYHATTSLVLADFLYKTKVGQD